MAAKGTFQGIRKDPTRKVKQFKTIEETSYGSAKQSFDKVAYEKQKKAEAKAQAEEQKHKVGRPRKDKIYGTLRVSKTTVNAVNAARQVFDIPTQDDMVLLAIQRMLEKATEEEKAMYDSFKNLYDKRIRK